MILFSKTFLKQTKINIIKIKTCLLQVFLNFSIKKFTQDVRNKNQTLVLIKLTSTTQTKMINKNKFTRNHTS